MNTRYFGPIFGLALVLSIVACTATAETIPGSPTATNDAGRGTSVDDDETKDGGSSKSSSGSSGGSICEQLCEKGASASCAKQSTCVADCETELKQIPAGCKEQADAANECAIGRGTGWKCSSKGRPQVSGGCDDEAQALVDCVLNGGAGGGGGGNGSCGTLTSGSQTCDACVQQKCCSIQKACSDDAECVAILDCFNDCNDDACFTQCEQDHPSGVAKEQALYGCISGPKCGQACK